jgi:hypothetical protein
MDFEKYSGIKNRRFFNRNQFHQARECRIRTGQKAKFIYSIGPQGIAESLQKKFADRLLK